MPSFFELRMAVEEQIKRKAPGVLMLLNHYSRQRFGMRFVDAVFSMPRKVFEMMKEVYEGEVTARVVMKRLVMKPIAEVLGDPDLADELMSAAMEGCSSFVNLLRRYGVRGLSPGICRD